jgi:D-arabinose 5-phosphate isomerase GutQ
MANKHYDEFQIDLLKLLNEDSKHLNDTTVICELPFYLQHIEHIERCQIIYNFNWTYVEGYCQNNILLQSSDIEKYLAKLGYPIALLSEMQYAAFEEINQDLANVAVMTKIYSKQFVHLQFDSWIKHYVSGNKEAEELAAKHVEDFNNLLMLDKTFIYLFPYRLNDERYQLSSVLNLAKLKATKTGDNVYVYLLNPTGVELSTILIDEYVHPNVKVVDLSAITTKSSKISRLLYISFLKTIYLHEKTKGYIPLELPHYELDMHLSLAEHITFAKSSTHCSAELYAEIQEKYVDDTISSNMIDSEILDDKLVRFDEVDYHDERIVELSDLAIQSIVSNITSFKTSKQLLKNITKLVDLILLSNQEDRAIYFTGIGKNQTVAEKTANTFRSLGFAAHSINPISGLHGDMGMLKTNDLVIAISKSGKTSELNNFLQYIAKHKAVNVVSFQQTGLNASTIVEKTELAKTSDIVIDLPQVDELEASNTVPTLSTIIMQAYLDIIATICSEKLNYSIEDFRLNHPGGIIGSTK